MACVSESSRQFGWKSGLLGAIPVVLQVAKSFLEIQHTSNAQEVICWQSEWTFEWLSNSFLSIDPNGRGKNLISCKISVDLLECVELILFVRQSCVESRGKFNYGDVPRGRSSLQQIFFVTSNMPVSTIILVLSFGFASIFFWQSCVSQPRFRVSWWACSYFKTTSFPNGVAPVVAVDEAKLIAEPVSGFLVMSDCSLNAIVKWQTSSCAVQPARYGPTPTAD